MAPAITVNQFNRLNHRSELFFSLFKPQDSVRWSGNLKGYLLKGTPAVLTGVNGEPVIDESTGYFNEMAQSLWSPTIDGSNVEEGGAASQLDANPDNRNIYTYLGAYSPNINQSLINAANGFHEDNQQITKDHVGARTDEKRNLVLRWARGFDLKDNDNDGNLLESRRQMGDIIHSSPRVVTYGGTDKNPDSLIFFGTNEGFLHAIDTQSGKEVFSFIPKETMKNLTRLYDNTAQGGKIYGLDSTPTIWVQDKDADGNIEKADGDHVYLYFGMRRGGKSLYALDITDKNAPSLLWAIEGGSNDYKDLGQTWSKPAKTQIMINETELRDVLVFGGGFDTNQERVTTRTADNHGAAIYIVDAKTGERLWTASSKAHRTELRLQDMKYSIPSDVAVIDINSDGIADQFYVGDMGGQLWRFDVHSGKDLSNLITGGVIADIAGDVPSANRRLFNEPDVALIATETGGSRLAISFGSGTRFNPLDQSIEDRFYVIFQDDAYIAPDRYKKLTELDLENRTQNTDLAFVKADGWYINLEHKGEKVMASSTTVNDQILFTTYEPRLTTNKCQVLEGKSRLYLMHLWNGAPTQDLDGNGKIEPNDVSTELNSTAIPPAPRILFPEDSKPVILVGAEQPLRGIELGEATDWTDSYWYEKD